MPRRKNPPRVLPSPKAAAERLGRALARRKKDELIDFILDLAREDRTVMRRLEEQFGVDAPPSELVAATRIAIADATDFDEREINYNFDYDYGAYEAIKRNFKQLIELGHLREAMELSLELMSQGSYQVEMSDEGLMTHDIEECLQVVIKALKKSKLPAGDVVAWCDEMVRKDRGGFICDDELRGLRERFEST